MKKRMYMYVYNDITTDARVQRAANALADDFELTLISTQKGKTIQDTKYKNVLVGGNRGKLNVFSHIFSALRIIRKANPEVVYCHDYYSSILAYLLIKINYRGMLIYDAHELIIPEKGNRDRRQSFFYWFEKRIVHKVHLLVCASVERGLLMEDHYGLTKEPLVIPNISQLQINDTDKDVEAVLESLKEFFFIPKLTVVYAGAVTSSRRIDELLRAVYKLHHKCKLLIVGNGDAFDRLKREAASYTGFDYAFTGSVPYKCLGSILHRCDIGFLYYPMNTLNNIYCASNKIYEYASVGLPMLSNENPTVEKILEKYEIGISTVDFTNGLVAVIEDIEVYKKNCDSFTENNQWTEQAERLKQTITTLLTSSK